MASIREIKVLNTLTGKKEQLETRTPGKLTMYSCGPTVYGFIHIGNLRAALVPDLFHRYFKRVGYEVTFVRNYTDVDDKIIDRANKEGVTPADITRKYTMEVEKDYAVAGMLEPTHKTLATEHIPEMIGIIEALIARGHAYLVKGEVLFSIDSFKEYGKLSKRNLEELEAGHRVEINDNKRNPHDFTLWKPAKPGEPSWPSPWGAGRPGWHIECSAMASKWLGPQIDVHHGGEDLVFPHHENEIAQSECSSGKAPFVKYWLHNAFLKLSSQKMSKSLGNVFNARDFLTQFGGEFARYAFLTVHYRSILDFSEETIEHTLDGLKRIYEAKQKALDLLKTRTLAPDMRAESLWGEFVADCAKARKEIDDAFANDFNTPGAMAALFSLIREFNRVVAEPRATSTGTSVIGAQHLLEIIEKDIGGILGFGLKTPEAALEDLQRIRQTRSAIPGAAAKPTKEQIDAKIQERLDARKAKDFKRADQIRDELLAQGVVLKDSPQGTTWEYK